MRKQEKKNKEDHGGTSLQVWIYAKLYPEGVPWVFHEATFAERPTEEEKEDEEEEPEPT